MMEETHQKKNSQRKGKSRVALLLTLTLLALALPLHSSKRAEACGLGCVVMAALTAGGLYCSIADCSVSNNCGVAAGVGVDHPGWYYEGQTYAGASCDQDQSSINVLAMVAETSGGTYNDAPQPCPNTDYCPGQSGPVFGQAPVCFNGAANADFSNGDPPNDSSGAVPACRNP